jgi:hypothetical protein
LTLNYGVVKILKIIKKGVKMSQEYFKPGYDNPTGWHHRRSELFTVFSFLIPKLSEWESLDEVGEGRFKGVWWHELTEPQGLEIEVEGEKIIVTTLGLQRLDGPNSLVLEHLEIYELVHPLVGDAANMNIRNTPNDIPMTHPLRGSFETEDELEGMIVSVFQDGSIRVGEKKIEPVITKAGQHHGTEGGPMVYLVIKGDVR